MSDSHVPSSVLDGWLAADPDQWSRNQLQELRARADAGDTRAAKDLGDAFAGPLTFGTAGLRAPLGAGPGRMNRIVVMRAARGIADWLHANTELQPGARIIIGHDARHQSEEFARASARVFAAAGIHPLLTPGPTPTPVVVWGIRELRCVAGIVVTASHNPPQDNGYKVYLGDGSQIISPTDAEIAACIDAWAQRPFSEIPTDDDIEFLRRHWHHPYLSRVASLIEPHSPRQLTWVHTALHGVASMVVREVADACGFEQPHVVASQENPDPDFPTVLFPNPEEPGAIDEAVTLAESLSADIVVANDPDADRCAVALPDEHGWRMLTGDELGAILGAEAIRRYERGVLANSIVSSTLLGKMAAAAGIGHVTTLTGFKWIGRVPDLAYGYEEAIGYCCDPAVVADKDGISALAIVLGMAARAKFEGSTLLGLLDDIYRTHGVHHTSQLSYRVEDLGLIRAAMQRLREDPPTTLLGSPVAFTDLSLPDGVLPPTDGVILAGDDLRVIVRPSGTEPKLKCYLEVREADVADLAAAKERARANTAALKREVSKVLGL